MKPAITQHLWLILSEACVLQVKEPLLWIRHSNRIGTASCNISTLYLSTVRRTIYSPLSLKTDRMSMSFKGLTEAHNSK